LRGDTSPLNASLLPPIKIYWRQTYLLSTGEAASEASVGGEIPKEDPLPRVSEGEDERIALR